MAKPWRTIATEPTAEGPLQLRQRGDAEFLIVIAGRILMSSTAQRSEQALATVGLAGLAKVAAPRVLIGGLGMAFTLRAALDALSSRARVEVAELNPVVHAWCSGPLAALTDSAVTDSRVRVVVRDVARVIAEAPGGGYDAILLDLYEGPNTAMQGRDDPFYGTAALGRSLAALAPRGVLGVWSEDADAPFAKRFAAAGFAVRVHRFGSGRRHVIYLGAKS